MLIITGTIRIPSGQLAHVQPAMREMITASRAEDGCLAYSYALDVLDDGLVHVHEVWTDRTALEAHFASPHLAAWRAQFDELGITDRSLVSFEIDATSPV
ncbi:putative quinol monooxygenase [uncultured Erythrobacter sp.]|uniref:putative quinol monooxygenase n=1 Tax=uncultured Erythrobacter sp. TaxID=263913 RepID=UPI00262DF44B|nr:putative quinol monooxygenase [uncultured Erythrobacter sp.]